jgi:hypothetical protein
MNKIKSYYIMSAESQPDPILPNYNPSSWDVPTLSAEERAILDTEYITFPIAQNQDITFPIAPFAPTLPVGTNTTQVATTGFVENAITAFRGAINVWSNLNTFTNLIATLSAPLTLSYLPSTITSSNLGHVINVSIANATTIPITFTTLATINLTQGRWLVMCNINSNGGGGNTQITQNLQDGATVLNTAYDVTLNTGNFTSSLNTAVIDNTSSSVSLAITAVAKASATGLATVDISFIRAIRVG